MTNPKHTDTSPSGDLVKMLRAGDLCGLTLAADRIEALEAENERLREALERAKGCLSADWQHDTLCLQHMVATALTLLDGEKHGTDINIG